MSKSGIDSLEASFCWSNHLERSEGADTKQRQRHVPSYKLCHAMMKFVCLFFQAREHLSLLLFIENRVPYKREALTSYLTDKTKQNACTCEILARSDCHLQRTLTPSSTPACPSSLCLHAVCHRVLTPPSSSMPSIPPNFLSL